MSLNPALSSASSSSAATPDAKLTFNINAFNGNKTNFGGCSAPRPKSMTTTIPVQPMRDVPSTTTTTTKPLSGVIMAR